MKPIDLRDDAWRQIQDRLQGDRQAVHTRLIAGGPATALELAAALGRDKDSVRPRLSELFGLGLVRVVGKQGKMGVYEAVPVEQAAQAWRNQVEVKDGEQMRFGI